MVEERKGAEGQDQPVITHHNKAELDADLGAGKQSISSLKGDLPPPSEDVAGDQENLPRNLILGEKMFLLIILLRRRTKQIMLIAPFLYTNLWIGAIVVLFTSYFPPLVSDH